MTEPQDGEEPQTTLLRLDSRTVRVLVVGIVALLGLAGVQTQLTDTETEVIVDFIMKAISLAAMLGGIYYRVRRRAP